MKKNLLLFLCVFSVLICDAGINLGNWTVFNASKVHQSNKKVAYSGLNSSMLTGTFSCGLSQSNPNCVETQNFLPGLQGAISQGQLAPSLFCYTLLLSGVDVTANFQDVYCNNPGALPSGIVVLPINVSTSDIIGSQSAAANSIVNYSYPTVAGNYYAWNAVNGTIIAGQGTGSITVQWSTQCGIVQVVEFVDGICPAPTVCLEVQIIGANCVFPGCTQIGACNYDPAANTNDGSCLFPNSPCDDLNSNTVSDTYNSNCECVGLDNTVAGCTDPTACNYDINANLNDGSCYYLNAGVISGNANPLIGETVTYSTPFAAGVTYNWTVSGSGNTVSINQNSVVVQWNSAGNFTLELTLSSGLCSVTSTYGVNVDCNFPAISILGDQSVQNNEIITFSTGMIAGANYTWVLQAQPAGSANIISGFGTNVIQVQFGSNFISATLSVTVGDGTCTDSFSITLTDLIETEEDLESVILFPNPANESITIAGIDASANLTYHIADLSGRWVASGVLRNAQINLIDLAASTYFLELRSNGLPIARRRFIKN